MLIVDDETNLLHIFSAIVFRAFPDVDVDTAQNGAQALRCFSNGHHALLLMDLNMPVMDGKTAFVRIRTLCSERRWAMPGVVFCTGSASDYDLRDVLPGGRGNCVLQKPVTSGAVVDALKILLPLAVCASQ